MPKSDAQADGRSRRGATAGETRGRILRAAAELVGERGWDAVTTRAIADRAGVNQALIHYHFGSMEALLREAVLAVVTDALEAATAPLMTDAPLADGLRSIGGELAAIDPASPLGILFIETLLRMSRDPILDEAMVGELRAFRRLLAERLEVEIAAGRVRSDIVPTHLSAALTAALDGLLLHQLADPSTDPSGAAEALVRLLEPERSNRRS